MTLPKTLPDSSFEDLQELDDDIDNLFKTYVVPIDNIRSKGKISLSSNVNNTANLSSSNVFDFANIELSNKPLESRIHAFYRMIGLPVVAPDGNFYNPGFDSTGNNTLNSRQKINSSIAQNGAELQNFIFKREDQIRNNADVFASQDITGAVYALLLRHSFPFSLLKGKEPLDIDLQNYSIADRNQEISILSSNNPIFNDSILSTTKFNTVQHAIKPFIVDYKLENIVTPDYNKICVPFLKNKRSVKINSNDSLLRPGIELIIRQRLGDVIDDVNFLKAAQNLLQPNTVNLFTDDVDIFTLQTEVNILATNNNVSNNVQTALSGVSSIQVNTVSKLIKTIKICVKILSQAYTNIDNIKSKINFCPIFGKDGPISGSLNISNINGFKTSSSNIDLQISELKIKKLNAERQATEFADLGLFASPFVNNNFSEKSSQINDKIDELTNSKNRLLKDGADAIKIIEVIKGEISGLGIVDILATYAALWSLDLDTLLSFLDDASFNRMILLNPSFLAITQVSSRKNAQKPIVDILTCLKLLENKITQILSFADVYLNNFQTQSPVIANNLNLEGT